MCEKHTELRIQLTLCFRTLMPDARDARYRTLHGSLDMTGAQVGHAYFIWWLATLCRKNDAVPVSVATACTLNYVNGKQFAIFHRTQGFAQTLRNYATLF